MADLFDKRFKKNLFQDAPAPGRTKAPNYFEATLQLRDCKNEALNFVLAFVDNQDVPDYFVSAINKVKNGFDIYLSSNKLAIKIATHLPKKFGGRIQTSSKLFSRDKQTSKNLMRLTVVYRGLDFDVGDVLALPVKRTVVQIKKLGATVRCRELSSWRMTGFVPNRLTYTLLEVKKSRVAVLKPKIQILDLETYQPIDVMNPDIAEKAGIEVDSEVEIVYFNGWWIVRQI